MSNLSNYEKTNLHDHIYNNPDTYVGGSDEIDEVLPIFMNNTIITTKITYVPAIYKLFDEILVNCRDQYIRLSNDKNKNIHPVTKIKINFEEETQMWTIYNDGNGIDIADHPTEKDKNGNPINIVKLIFGELLTSKNYKEKGKIVGGKNGYGAKLTNIFSKLFIVETIDHKRGLKYIQEWSNNMKDVKPAKITKIKQKPYTKISWIVDFQRFGIQSYNKDMYNLMVRRIYDIAGITSPKVKIYLNNELIKQNSFLQYSKLYVEQKPILYESLSDRWEIAVCISDNDKFEQISFVNGIFTPKGGKHVDIVSKLIIDKISTVIKRKHKQTVPDHYIKNNLQLFMNTIIEDPSFDSQAKERLITTKSKFGSIPEISDKLIKKIISDTSIIDKVLSFSEFKQKKIASKSNGSKTIRIKNIPKLDDANLAGTKHSLSCTLILTEGDSAKTMAISGLKKIGRDNYGIYPLRGKTLNVKDISIQQVLKNNEINDLIKIIGLEINKEYTKDSLNKLRYGQILIMTDQDHDGSHIKGLLLCLFHTLWPSLLTVGFLSSMITPIIKVSHGNQSVSFYNISNYEEWKSLHNDKKWKIKYYKGLGTSTAKEALEYFETKKIMKYNYNETTNQSIDLAFKKDQSDCRKEWLYNYNPTIILHPDQTDVPISEFINKELIHFSNSDTLRSIGSLVDGLKPSQRKILYCCFKRKLYKEIKVAQLSGYVSENSAYHHGEMSLQNTIIGMAQQFIGSNNINILEPNGQFGSRIMGGSDSASPRYIFTELNRIVNSIFPELDFPLLNYLQDDGISVEPRYYIPIIPFVLVNGLLGIGTGFSSYIPKYNPKDIILNVKRKIQKKPYKPIHPWFQGFQGTIHKLNSKSYITKGVYKILSPNKIEITELPIGTWTYNYKCFLDGLLYDKTKEQKSKFYIKDYIDRSDDTNVHFIITLLDKSLTEGIKCISDYIDSIEQAFKLTTTKYTNLTNIHLYNKDNVIQKYNSIFEIFDEHYEVRYELYKTRKQYLLSKLELELKLHQSKLRFIQYVINDTIVVYKHSKSDIIDKLVEYEFLQYDGTQLLPSSTENGHLYNYLLHIQIHQLTIDKVKELKIKIDQIQTEYDTIMNTSIEDMWIQELDSFSNIYNR